MVSKRTEELLRLDREHILHAAFPAGQNAGRIFERGEGVMIYDTEGKGYMDLSSQLVSVNLGHGRKEIIEAIIEQIKTYQFGTTFYGLSNVPSIECSQKLAELTQPGLKHFHYVSGGSEANETAFRIARQYWHKKGMTKYRIISLWNCYHGIASATGSSSALASGLVWKSVGPKDASFFHIPNYDCYNCPFDLEYPNCNIRCARFLEQSIEQDGKESIAAFIAEPIQGSGGCISPPPEYWPIVRKICTAHEVLLIADEVMSGWARSGPLFAMENWNVVPDIMTVAKGITGGYLPFGAAIINDDIYKILEDENLYGFTHSCNPVCAAAATAAMGIYQKEKITEHVIELGKHIDERLKADFLPLTHVGALNGQGLFRALRIVKDKTSRAAVEVDVLKEIQRKGFENGLFMRISPGFGMANVFFCPPLTATMDEVDRGLDKLLPIIASIKL